MGIFKTIGATATATGEVIQSTAGAITEVAEAGKISASVLTIKAKSLKEEAVIEASKDRLANLSKYKELRGEMGSKEDLSALEDEFETLMEAYQ